MLDSFLTFVNDHRLALSEAPTLLAVSGGVDSMVLADLFRRTDFPYALAHCNFGLRGKESDADEHFVRQWAQDAGVPCHVRSFPTQHEASSRHISIQMAARDLRYAWFDELLEEFGYAHLALAHHADDSIETVLLNLARGTGLAGLLGIAPVRSPVIRPLLYTSKQAILDYARHQTIAWQEDSSNATDHYRRNILRHRVMPVLRELNPSLEDTFRHTTERLRAASALLDSYLATWQAQAVQQEGDIFYIDITMLHQAQEPIYQLHSVLDSFGYTYAQTQNIVAALDATSGKQFYSSTHCLVKDRSQLIIRPRNSAGAVQPILIAKTTPHTSLLESGTLVFVHHVYSSAFAPSADKNIAYFDEALVRFPLTVRPWKQGDWFCPFGMHGKRKKVSDLLVESKVPVSHKRDCLVLHDANQAILWVVGLRSDDRFRIHSHTVNYIRAEFVPPQHNLPKTPTP